MAFKLSLFFICYFISFSQTTIQADRDLFVPMQRSWDLLINSNSFHTAKVGNSFGFELSTSQQEVMFDNASYTLGDHRLSSFRMRSLRSSITLPIYLQIGVNLTLPTYTIYNFDTSLSGYFITYQFDHLFFDWLPDMALQFDQNNFELGAFFSSSSKSANIHISKDISKFTLYAGMIYSSNESTLKLSSEELNDSRIESYARFGISFNFLLFSLYGESTLVDGFKQYSAGLSLSF